MQPDRLFTRPTSPDHAVTMLASLFVLLFPPLLFIGSAGTEIALSCTAALFLAHSLLTRNWYWLAAPWVSCLLLLWLYMIARGLFAEQPHEALRRALPFIRYITFAAALGYWLMRDAAMRRYFLVSLGATLCFIMADGLLQRVQGTDLFGRYLLADAIGNIRLTGPFGQTKPIMGIVLAWLSFPVALFLLMRPDGTWKPYRTLLPGIAFSLSILCMIALSGERMALLLTLLGWGLVVLFTGTSKRLLLGLALTGIVAFGLLSVAVPSMFNRQVTATVDTFRHWEESPYGKIMQTDLRLAVIHPFVGFGANHFRIACPEIYPGADPDFLKGVCNIHPHNIFFEWLIEQGIFGLALFLTFLTQTFKTCRQGMKLATNRALLVGWGVAFALRIWPIGSTTGFFSNWGAPPFWLALGMLIAYSNAITGKKDDAGTSLPF